MWKTIFIEGFLAKQIECYNFLRSYLGFTSWMNMAEIECQNCQIFIWVFNFLYKVKQKRQKSSLPEFFFMTIKYRNNKIEALNYK